MSRNLWYLRGSCSNCDLTLSTKETASVLMNMKGAMLEGTVVVWDMECRVEDEMKDRSRSEWSGFLWEFECGGSTDRALSIWVQAPNDAVRKTAN